MTLLRCSAMKTDVDYDNRITALIIVNKRDSVLYCNRNHISIYSKLVLNLKYLRGKENICRYI